MVEWQQMAIYGDCSLTILRLAVITANNDSYIRPKPDVRKRPLTANSGRSATIIVCPDLWSVTSTVIVQCSRAQTRNLWTKITLPTCS